MVFAYFEPWTGIIGGAIIGLSAASLLLLNGEVLGASGIVSTTLLSPAKALTDKTMTWKVVFLAAFAILSNLYVLIVSEYDDKRMGEDPSTPILSTAGYLLAGFLVGFGTKLGNGCTSGHGICGLARFSLRSLAAVMTFLATAFMTQAFVSPENRTTRSFTQFLRKDSYDADSFVHPIGGWSLSAVVIMVALVAVYNLHKNENSAVNHQIAEAERTAQLSGFASNVKNESEDYKNFDTSSSSGDAQQSKDEEVNTKMQGSQTAEDEDDSHRKLLGAVLAGGLFAVGLAVSGMIYQSKVFGFLNLYLLFKTGTYDPTLIMVMGGGCVVSMVAYQMVEGFHMVPSHPWIRSSPVMCSKFSVPRNQAIDMKLLAGAVCFGLGWGLGGICPGPGIFLAMIGAKPVLFFWWPTFVIGSWMAQKVKETLL